MLGETRGADAERLVLRLGVDGTCKGRTGACIKGGWEAGDSAKGGA